MNTEERLVKARIKLQGRNPFFSYLSLFLKFKKDEKGILKTKTMGVSVDGVLIYNDKFVEKLNDDELVGVMCHEILHLSLIHLTRRKNRDREIWNVACDLAVNHILNENDIILPKNGLIPTKNGGEFKLAKNINLDVKGKVAEQIYDEIYDKAEKICGKGGKGIGTGENGSGSGIGSGLGEGFDEHIEKKELSEAEKSELEDEWLGRIEEAYISAKQKGSEPAGLERYIEELKKSQVNWKALLQKHIQSLIQTDFTWARRSKKSMATKIYLPATLKEGKVEVVIGIDTSGSIGQEELTDFISEVVGMAKAFNSQIDMRIMCHDAEVQTDYEVRNGNMDKIMAIKIKGGGGTSHFPLFLKVKKDYKRTKALICFTDCYSDIQDINFKDYPFQKIFIVSKCGDKSIVEKKDCVAIQIKNTGEY